MTDSVGGASARASSGVKPGSCGSLPFLSTISSPPIT